MDDKITYKDIEEYSSLFSLAPSFLLERFARKNSNIVLKFKPQVQNHLNGLNSLQKSKLDIMLNSEIEDLQAVLHEAFLKTNKKQYKILSNPEYKHFIEINLDEIRRMI